MQYQSIGQGAQFPYPNQNIDPYIKQNDPEFCLQYARAAYFDFSNGVPKGILSNNQGDYEKYRLYGLGKQPINQYKKNLGISAENSDTWLVIDWSVRPIVSMYRDKAISKLMKNMKGIVATPIDMMAKAEMENWYEEMKAKMAVRQMMQKTNPQLAMHPMLMPQSGEPLDMEELDMRVMMGEQFNRSKDAEEAIELGLYENKYDFIVRGIFEDLFDYGITGYKEWLGDDNKAKFRKVRPEAVVTNFCRQADFSDMVHGGEVIDVSLIDLALLTDKAGNKLFNEKDLIEFAGTIAGKWGNPVGLGNGVGYLKPYDKFRCKVLDICFYSYDEEVYRTANDGNGNADFRKASYNRGKTSDKYSRKCFRKVYKGKWIIGTDKIYEWGLMEDQKLPQNPKKKSKAELPYKFIAYNFSDMQAQGMMERLIPYLDDYQMTIYKIQNFKNRAVPSGWWIDFDALENVAFNKGGKNMIPKEVLQMFFETGVLLGRSKDAAGNPQSPNWKPIIPIENTAASELAMFYQDIVTTLEQLQNLTGFNDATMGDANPKTLVPGYELADQSTNDALFPLAFAETQLKQSLANDVLIRMQQGVKRGEVTGYAPYRGALNKNTLNFIKVNPVISMREYGIMLQEKTTEQEKAWLMQMVQQDIANQLLDTSDACLIIETHNAKQAMAILSYKVKKAKELMQQGQQALQQQQAQNNMQIAQQQEQMKQQGAQAEFQFELQKQNQLLQSQVQMNRDKLSAELQMKQLELGVKDKISTDTGNAKIIAANVTADAKVESAHIQANTDVATEHISGIYNNEKQKISNQKPSSSE